MRYIGSPEFDISPREIFERLSQSYQDANQVDRLMSCADMVENDASRYICEFPNGLLEIERRKLVNGVNSSELQRVYSEKFSRRGSIGRAYYDKILARPIHGICPICGERIASNLDHYLPQSEYATLVVNPNNLIPICRDCNYIKRNYSFLEASAAPLHPYFDNLEKDIWLFASLRTDLTAKYYVRCPTKWPYTLKKRVHFHFELYKLNELYSIKAAQEIVDSLNYWRKILQLPKGEVELLEYFEARLKSYEISQMNSWSIALYRGLIREIQVVYDCLNPPLHAP